MSAEQPDTVSLRPRLSTPYRESAVGVEIEGTSMRSAKSAASPPNGDGSTCRAHLLSLLIVGALSVFGVTRRQEVIDDEVGYSMAQIVPVCKVKAEMLSSEDAA